MMTPDRAALGLDTTGCASCQKRNPARYAACVKAIRAGDETPCESDARTRTVIRRSTIARRAYEVLRAQGRCTSGEIAERIGHQRSATEKALRSLHDDGIIQIVGKRKSARVYEVTR